MALCVPRDFRLQVGDARRQLGRALGGGMNGSPEHMAQHVDLAEDPGMQIIWNVTVGLKRPVGTGDAARPILAFPDSLELLPRSGATNDAQNTLVSTVEQLLHGTRKRPVSA